MFWAIVTPTEGAYGIKKDALDQLLADGDARAVVQPFSIEALEASLRHRRAGATLHVETCPHYLTHDIDWEKSDVGEINLPLRDAADR